MAKNPSENFKYLGKVDIKTIKDSLDKLDWEKFMYRQQSYAVHKHTQSVPLIFDNDSIYQKDCRNNPTYHKDFNICKKIFTKLKQKFKKKLGEGFIIRALLVKLKNNSTISPHMDTGLSLSSCNRVHIPIATNHQVIFTVGGESKYLKPGEMWEINNSNKLHSVCNSSNKNRVHLIVDWMKQCDIKDLQ